MTTLFQFKLLVLNVLFGVFIYILYHILSYQKKEKFSSVCYMGIIGGVFYCFLLESQHTFFQIWFSIFIIVGIKLGSHYFKNMLNKLCAPFYLHLNEITKVIKKYLPIILVPPFFGHISRFYKKKWYRRRLKRSSRKKRRLKWYELY